jgi:co-chaperonin GroES (HSP10)
MKTKPLGYHVLIEVDKVEETSAGGIIMATKTESKREQEGHSFGKVVAFGPTAYKGLQGCESPDDWGIAAGDNVRFTKYDGVYDGEGDEVYRLVRDTDIISVENTNE